MEKQGGSMPTHRLEGGKDWVGYGAFVMWCWTHQPMSWIGLNRYLQTLQSSFLLISPKKIYQVFQTPLLLTPYLGSTGCHPLASFPSAPVLHLLKEPEHSYVFLALGNSESVNVTLALCCLKNYPMFASSVATSSSCCISSEMTLDHY